MIILGIETSCDDTSVSVLKIKESKEIFPHEIEVLSLVTDSQTVHTEYGGVVPVLAAQLHEENLPNVLEKALHKAKGSIDGVNLIAVTRGPGLAPALKRGVSFAKNLARGNTIPIVGTNHMEGHLYSGFLDHDFSKIQFPILHLIVSGGHTELILMTDHGEYQYLGRTLDDAVGEAYDKVARMIGLPYPGGPEIEKEALKGSATAFDFPRPMIHSKNLDFSFAGLKTAVLYAIQKAKKNGKTVSEMKSDVAASFQASVIETLVHKTKKAVEQYQPTRIMISGGVSLNSALRSALEKEFTSINITFPEPKYTGDNAAMIALAGYLRLTIHGPDDPKKLDIDPNLTFTT